LYLDISQKNIEVLFSKSQKLIFGDAPILGKKSREHGSLGSIPVLTEPYCNIHHNIQQKKTRVISRL
jgi:hypothetical protein